MKLSEYSGIAFLILSWLTIVLGFVATIVTILRYKHKDKADYAMVGVAVLGIIGMITIGLYAVGL